MSRWNREKSGIRDIHRTQETAPKKKGCHPREGVKDQAAIGEEAGTRVGPASRLL